MLREAGLLKGESLYDVENVAVVHHVNQALRAHKLFQRDKDYIVKNDEVVIIDEFTGRMMPGRRYSEGLHQALEAKEHVADPAREPDARLDHLPELFPPLRQARRHDRHGADRSRRVRRHLRARRRRDPDQRAGRSRVDEDDEVYRTAEEKYEAIVDADRATASERGQPVLVGTTSIEKSETARRTRCSKDSGIDATSRC